MRTLEECEELIRKYPPYNIFEDDKALKEDIEESKKFKEQHGFVDSDTWNLDYTFACFILPRLCHFRDTTYSVLNDSNINDEIDWYNILDKMVEAFYLVILDSRDVSPFNNSYDRLVFDRNIKIKEGLNLFGKYFNDLWD